MHGGCSDPQVGLQGRRDDHGRGFGASATLDRREQNHGPSRQLAPGMALRRRPRSPPSGQRPQERSNSCASSGEIGSAEHLRTGHDRAIAL